MRNQLYFGMIRMINSSLAPLWMWERTMITTITMTSTMTTISASTISQTMKTTNLALDTKIEGSVSWFKNQKPKAKNGCAKLGPFGVLWLSKLVFEDVKMPTNRSTKLSKKYQVM